MKNAMMRMPFRRTATDGHVPQSTASEIPMHSMPSELNEKNEAEVNAQADDQVDLSKGDLVPTENAQAGVKAAEAVTLSWSRNALIGAFVK